MKVCLVAFCFGYDDNPAMRLSDLLSIFKSVAEETYIIIGEIAEDIGLRTEAIRNLAGYRAFQARIGYEKSNYTLAAEAFHIERMVI